MATRSFVALTLTVVYLGGCRSASPTIGDLFSGAAGQWVDLTYSLSAETLFWPTATPFELEEVAYGMTDAGYFYAAYDFRSAEHGGTHLDAPIHFAADRHTTDEVPLASLIGRAVVVDVSDRATPDYLVQVSDLEGWEATHGVISDGSIVLIRTGWGSRWPDRERYLGTARLGPEAVPELHFPGLAPEAAQWLVDRGTVRAVGIDTPSLDYGQSSTYETHRILYEQNIPGFENVADLELLPATGSFVVALPMKIEGGSGAPLRIVAFVPGP